MGYRAKLSDGSIIQPAVDVLAHRLTPQQANEDFFQVRGSCPDCQQTFDRLKDTDHAGTLAGLARIDMARALEVHYTSAYIVDNVMLRTMHMTHLPNPDHKLCRLCAERKLAHHAAVVQVISEWAAKSYPDCIIEVELQITIDGAPPETFKPDICGYARDTRKPVFCIEYQRSYETFRAFQRRHEVRHREFDKVFWYFDQAVYNRASAHRTFLYEREEGFYSCKTDKESGQLIRDDGAPPNKIIQPSARPKLSTCVSEYALNKEPISRPEQMGWRPIIDQSLPMLIRGGQKPRPRVSTESLISAARARGYTSPHLIQTFLKGSGVDLPFSKVKQLLAPKEDPRNDASDQLTLFA